MAQTRLLEELLNDLLNTANLSQFNYCVKHDFDYDSDLTECEEADLVENKSSNSSSSQETNGDDDEKKKPSNSKSHRSMRVKELNLVIKEGPGLLTRRLHETLKSIRSTNSSVVNPNNLFTSLCKK